MARELRKPSLAMSWCQRLTLSAFSLMLFCLGVLWTFPVDEYFWLDTACVFALLVLLGVAIEMVMRRRFDISTAG